MESTINKAIKEARELFNKVRDNLSSEEINRIREKLYKKEAVYNSLKEKEQKDSLTNEEKKVLKNIDMYLKNISMHLKNLKKHFKKLQNLTKKAIPQIMILMYLKRLESFLINVEVIFYVKKQMKLEKKLNKKEAVHKFLKEKVQKVSLTSRENRVLRNIDRYLKNFKKDLDKLQKYQDNITYGLEYLFNELNGEDYYEPNEIKSEVTATGLEPRTT